MTTLKYFSDFENNSISQSIKSRFDGWPMHPRVYTYFSMSSDRRPIFWFPRGSVATYLCGVTVVWDRWSGCEGYAGAHTGQDWLSVGGGLSPPAGVLSHTHTHTEAKCSLIVVVGLGSGASLGAGKRWLTKAFEKGNSPVKGERCEQTWRPRVPGASNHNLSYNCESLWLHIGTILYFKRLH